jgi:hypothetical protein
MIMPATSSSPTRRRFVGAAAGAVAVAQLGLVSPANAQASRTRSAPLPAIKPGTHTSFGPLKQINAGVLNVAYAEAGPADGPPVVLLHGWPYDIYSFVDVVPLLASAGYRVLSRICAATARRAFFQARRSATASRRHSPSMSSR